MPGMAQWQKVVVPTTNDLYSITFPDSIHGFISGKGIVLKSIDKGENWDIAFTISSQPQLTNISFPSMDIGYVVGDNTLLKTIDGGENWFSLNPPPCYPLRGVWFHDLVTGLICGGGGIWRTEDGGMTWAEQQSSVVWLRRFSFPVPDTGYCCGDIKTLYKTTDGGKNWSLIQVPFAPNLSAVDFPDSHTGYVSGANGFISKTTDGGISWAQLNSGTSLNFENGLWASDPMNVYASGQSGVLLSTSDGGNTWGQEVTNTSSYLRGFCFLTTGNAFICGHDGTLLTKEFATPCMPSADFTFSRVQLSVYFQNKSICANQYWWDFGDGFYSDDIDPLHFYNEPGTYTVCLKAMDTVTMNYDITCKEVTVFKQQIEPESDWIIIYPNPCREKFWLKASDSLGVDRIKIFSSTGQLVWSEKVDLTVSNPCEISLNLAEAVYHLKGYRDDRVVFRKKLVVLYSH